MRPGDVGGWQRALVAALVMGLLGAAIACFANAHQMASDLDEGLAAARFLSRGVDPYSHVGPGLASPWPWPLYYPLPAFVLEMPFALLSDGAAHIAFMLVSCALLAVAVERTGSHRMVLFTSAAFFRAAILTQWSPLLTAAALWPALGFVYAAKPNIGAAQWAARPSRVALIGSVVLLCVGFAIDPGWIVHWLRASPFAEHLRPAIAYPWGWLMLLAVVRWRRPEARLLLFLALVPQTLAEYAALPLFLVTANVAEGLVLVVGTYAVFCYVHFVQPSTTDIGYIATSARAIVIFCFLPCLVMVLSRAPEGATWSAVLNRYAARTAAAIKSRRTSAE